MILTNSALKLSILQTAIGHWLEHLMPLVSINRMENIKIPARMIVLHLKRFHIFEWVRAAIGSALGVIQESYLPPVILQEEVGSVEQQFGERNLVRKILYLCEHLKISCYLLIFVKEYCLYNKL